ncbi:nucleotide exchange factor GrpE [Veillonella ratti]|uniref:nucleotide exchange factor GrpE n=1 Tax=Veillonella ratti TaxID=103892 RepID=UPI003F692855
MNVAGEPDVMVESAEDVAATEAKAAGETVTAEADAVKEALAEAEKRFVRLQADFDNFKRRTLQEKDQLAGFVKADVMKDLFSVLDNFERALQAPTNAETKAFLDGFVMIHQNLMAMLSKHGLAVIDAVGKPFDPNYHQAIMRVPSDEYEDDTVCEVLQTGYTVDGKTVRPAMVKVVHND